MILKDIIKDVNIIEIIGDENININNIEYDSMKVNEGDMFICLKGTRNNGHIFIGECINKGCVCFIIEEDVKYEEGITYIKVQNTNKAMAKLADNFFEHPSEQINLIGVTGTNGKTSIATFIKDILNENNKCGFIGTTGIFDGLRYYETENTTPNNLEIQRYLYKMINNDCNYCTMEVSSHALTLSRVDYLDFNIGIFTNLTEDHLDFHKTFEEYRNAKERLFLKTSDLNIINIDDINGRIILQNICKLKTPYYTYGINYEATFRAKDLKLYEDKTIYTLIGPNEIEEVVTLNMVGLFTVYNSLSLICTLYYLDMPIKEIIKYLENLRGVSGRFEKVENDKNLNVFVDYAHTPDALDNVLRSIKSFAKARVITVFGCGGNRDREKRPIMGKIAQEYSDFIIITSDNPRFEEPMDIIKEILMGFDMNNNNYITIEDRREAIKRAIEMADEEDVILIAGKGHETHQIIKNKIIEFDDKKVAKELIDNSYN